MMKFQSDFFCLMVIMFSLNQAALLSVQLFVSHQVLAGLLQGDLRNKLVFRGQSVIFTCNTSVENATQIMWTKGTSVFVYSAMMNQISSNLTSQRLRIGLSLPSKLNISHVQHDDAGLYTCTTTGKDGIQTIKWNITVSKKPEEGSSLYSLYILTSVIGLLLCGFTSAVCLCRKLRVLNGNPVQDQFGLETGGEVVDPQLQAVTDTRKNNKQRSQYMERLNSIYGSF